MYPAIFSRTYVATHIDKVLSDVRDDGFEGVQMNLSSFGSESLPPSIDNHALAHGRREAKRLSIEISALSGTYNMAHPSADMRHERRPRFKQVLNAAKQLGTPIVTLCTGSRDETDMWAFHPENASCQSFSDFRAELDWALVEAETLGLILAIEPEPGNVVSNARVARTLLDDVGAPHLKIILDAANLMGPGGLADQTNIVSEAIDLLGGDVVLAHAKDITTSGDVVAPGEGAVDLPGFVTALASASFKGPLIAHGFDTNDSALAGKAMRALCKSAP